MAGSADGDALLAAAVALGLDPGELSRELRRHRFHDPALAQAALVARVSGAVMLAAPARGGRGRWAVSQREAARQLARAEGISFWSAYYRVGQERAAIEAVETGRPVPSARERARHYRPGQRPGARITALLDGPARASVVEVDLATARRIGKHAEFVRILASGGQYRGRPLTPLRFHQLVSRWAPVQVRGGDEAPGEYRLLADPAAVLALLDAQRGGEAPPFQYERVR